MLDVLLPQACLDVSHCFWLFPFSKSAKIFGIEQGLRIEDALVSRLSLEPLLLLLFGGFLLGSMPVLVVPVLLVGLCL